MDKDWIFAFDEVRARLQQMAARYESHLTAVSESNGVSRGSCSKPAPSPTSYLMPLKVEFQDDPNRRYAAVSFDPEAIALQPPLPVAAHLETKLNRLLLGRRTRFNKEETEEIRRLYGPQALVKKGRYHYVEAAKEPLTLQVCVVLPNALLTPFDMDRIQAEATLGLMQLGVEIDETSFAHLRGFVRRSVSRRFQKANADLDEVTDKVMDRLREHYTRGKTAGSFTAYIRRCAVSVISKMKASAESPATRAEDWVPAKEAGGSNIPLSTIYRLRARGELPSKKDAAGRILVSLKVLNQIKEARNRRSALIEFLMDYQGLRRNSAFRRIKRAETRMGKPLEDFSNSEIKAQLLGKS